MRSLLASINSGDITIDPKTGHKFVIDTKVEDSIRAGKIVHVTGSDGISIEINQENLDQHLDDLRAALVNLRIRINPVLQELVSREDLGDLALFERIVLEAVRQTPFDSASIYSQASKDLEAELKLLRKPN